jgi:hypothetical protein
MTLGLKDIKLALAAAIPRAAAQLQMRQVLERLWASSFKQRSCSWPDISR